MLRDVFSKGDAVVSHRRPDAARRTWLFLFCRPHRRHLPLEGRECRHRRSGRSAGVVARHPRSQCLWRVACPGMEGRAGMAALVVDGGFQSGRPCRQLAEDAAGALCPADFPAAVSRRSRSPAPSSSARWIWCARALIPPRFPIRYYFLDPESGLYEAHAERLADIAGVHASHRSTSQRGPSTGSALSCAPRRQVQLRPHVPHGPRRGPGEVLRQRRLGSSVAQTTAIWPVIFGARRLPSIATRVILDQPRGSAYLFRRQVESQPMHGGCFPVWRGAVVIFGRCRGDARPSASM